MSAIEHGNVEKKAARPHFSNKYFASMPATISNNGPFPPPQ